MKHDFVHGGNSYQPFHRHRHHPGSRPDCPHRPLPDGPPQLQRALCYRELGPRKPGLRFSPGVATHCTKQATFCLAAAGGTPCRHRGNDARLGGNAEFLLPLAGPFLAVGLNVLLVDARNHGRSDHDGHSSLPRFADDLGNAVDWIRQQTEHAGPVALCGHSLGGGAALLCAAEREDIAAVISLATFAHPTDMMRRFMRKARIPDLLVPLVLRYVERVIGRRYDDIAPINTICRVTCPVLVMHGSSDRTVPHGDMEAMRRKCQGHPPEFVAIPGAGHSSVKRFMEHEGALVDFLKRAGF